MLSPELQGCRLDDLLGFTLFTVHLKKNKKHNDLIKQQKRSIGGESGVADSQLPTWECESTPLSEPWALTEGATTARDRAWREDVLLAGFNVRGRGVRGLAVDESESCTVTQLMTLAR